MPDELFSGELCFPAPTLPGATDNSAALTRSGRSLAAIWLRPGRRGRQRYHSNEQLFDHVANTPESS
jgi:hypothetical protein